MSEPPGRSGSEVVGQAHRLERRAEHELAGVQDEPIVLLHFDQTRQIGLVDGGVDEIHLVYNRFVSMITQSPARVRLLPLEVVEASADDTAPAQVYPLYEFEPSAEAVLDALLPRYIDSRILSALLSAAASEQASRQAAMKTATDNADDLIKTYTRLANTARQAEITQELTEIVGGADALAASAAGD